MARPQEQQVTQRRAIATIEDQNKYSMPDGRRLRVFADPIRMNVEAEVPDTVRLAQALAQVKPEMMDYLTDRASDQNAELFRQGSAIAMTGQEPEKGSAEWTKRGYDSYKGYLKGEELSDQLNTDWQMAQRELGTDFDSWYQQWWQEKAQGLDMSSQYFRDKFDSAFMKGVAQVKSKHIAEQGQLQVQENEAVITGTIFNTIKELREQPDGIPLEFSIYDVEALQKDMKLNLDGVTPQRLDELTYQTALMYAEQNDDPEVLKTFFLKHSDGTPSLADKKLNDGSRWGEKINSDIERITLREMQKEDLLAKRKKETLEKQRFSRYTELILDGKKTTDDINGLSKQMFEEGLFTSLSEASSEINQLFNLKKKEETQSQQISTMELVADIIAGKPVDEKYIISQLKAENISFAGSKEAFSALAKRKEELRKLANDNSNSAKQLASLYKDRSYTIGEGIIKNSIVIPRLASGATEDEIKRYESAVKMKAQALQIYASKAFEAKDKMDYLDLANEQVARINASIQTGTNNVVVPEGIDNYILK